ncbi:SusC/RagA family TonB-linked outer membrane protein [Elizabethkingia sp. JS20170427COW]|uniref:SusC/RagA family TonB-linked outer membrane protein n=1 Tax=Elizabethkingia sp. JS20170427COW TaxID=2583851 RepID=UPI00111053FF|nr:SusC/RagA family TonB-linked outer membrane protein [Elizabethkingia sp. JS20170427COW]QCX52276.1 SusC/RagA family TonB-linked outer membrane protein [Elizabethkingia sp. JS20170427COW]
MKRNRVLKIAPAFLLVGTITYGQRVDSLSKEQKIEEVVLIGYGKQKKEDLTGSISSVTAKDFNPGSTSADQMIQGKAAGVTVVGNGGNPGSGSTIRIRGGASLNASNDPLIVIDGIPMDYGGVSGATNALALINPNDIESFDILKDASAAAIYGNRASNGVIIITTKKGATGRLKIGLSSVVSTSTKMGNLDVLSADEFRDFVKNNASQNYIDKLGKANTNWQNQIYQVAWGTDNNISLSGGIKNLPYRLTLGYNEQEGIVKTNEFKRTSVGLNLNPKFFDKHLSVNASFKGSFTENRFPNAGAIGASQYFDPTQDVYDYSSRGNLVHNYWEWWLSGGINNNATSNPLGLLYGKRDISSVLRGIGNLQLDYKFHFLPDLHFNINGGYDYSKGSGVAVEYDGYRGSYLGDTGGTRRAYEQVRDNKLLEFYLNYIKEIEAINTKVDVIAGYSYQKLNNRTPSTRTYFGNPDKDKQSQYSNPYEANLVLLGYYARGIFTIADKYIISASIRRDASSRFYNGTDDLTNVWGTFPAVSVAWKLKQESFLKNVKAISDLKLRAGWGETGQQEIGNWYNSFPSYNVSEATAQYGFGDNFYFMYRPTQYNPNLTWETTRTINAGLDLGFLNNRITATIDWFRKDTRDLLAYVQVPAGEFSNKNWKNIGKMKTDGIEFAINATPIKNEVLTWDFSVNASHYNSKITSFSNQVSADYKVQVGSISGGTGNMVQAHAVGADPFSFWVYQQVYDHNGKPLDGVYVDRNGDGKITTDDKYFYKSTTPDVTLGFSTRLRYKNWDFSTSLRAVIGNYVYNNFASQSNVQSVTTNEFMNNIAASTAKYGFKTPQYWSDIFVEDASFLRMDNLSVGYNFGKILGNNKGDLRIYAMAQNVFVITKYSGVDPEVFGNIDNGFYQRPRVYSLGFNIQF